MDDLLTTSEVQALLKLDRTTIYRMIKAGRLAGVRVGQQWRFPRANVEALLSRDAAGECPDSAPEPPLALSPDVLPLHCMQAIQDVFAALGRVGALTTGLDGVPLTEPSGPGTIWQLLKASAAGHQYCIARWRALAERSSRAPQLGAGPAGLGCIHMLIELEGQPNALLVAGPFRGDTAIPDLDGLARELGLEADALACAAREAPCLDAASQTQVGWCMAKVGQTFETIGRERAQMIGRLRRIAALSALDEPLA
jgi:excisionase family DNA binding protein